MANHIRSGLAGFGLFFAITASALAATPVLTPRPIESNAQCDGGQDKKEKGEKKSNAEAQCGGDKKEKEEKKNNAEAQCGGDKKEKEEKKNNAE